jgi:CheY-like chemotaxis protein
MNPVAREILVVDGDANERASIEQVLLREGFDLTAAASGPSACGRSKQAVRSSRRRNPAAGAARWRDHDAPGQGQTTRLRCLFTSASVPTRLWSVDEFDDFIAKPA